MTYFLKLFKMQTLLVGNTVAGNTVCIPVSWLLLYILIYVS